MEEDRQDKKSRLKKYLLYVLYTIKMGFSNGKLWLGKRTGLIQTVKILPFIGFGNSEELFFLGRVLKDKGIGISKLEDSRWRNFKKMYKRFFTWEIPDVRIKAFLQGKSETALTDSEGYFQVSLKPESQIKLNTPWQEVHLELMDTVVKNQDTVQAVNRVVIPGENARFGIISDIDDTIVPTGATRIFEMLKNTFLRNAHSRIPFPGVSEFYRALQQGASNDEYNPVFYVSSSPWNLYGFLMEFMEINQIPLGPLMLRDLGLTKEHFISGSHNKHKLIQVERIFEIVKEIPFILIGDSGQHDPEIYLKVVKHFPERVKMIYIREAATGRKKALETGEKIRALGAGFLLVKNTMEAAHHAAENGWIQKDKLNKVDQKKERVEHEMHNSL